MRGSEDPIDVDTLLQAASPAVLTVYRATGEAGISAAILDACCWSSRPSRRFVASGFAGRRNSLRTLTPALAWRSRRATSGRSRGEGTPTCHVAQPGWFCAFLWRVREHGISTTA